MYNEKTGVFDSPSMDTPEMKGIGLVAPEVMEMALEKSGEGFEAIQKEHGIEKLPPVPEVEGKHAMKNPEKENRLAFEAEMDKGGLYGKYNIRKNYGETDPKAVYFVLRLDTDPIARLAILGYAMNTPNKNLAESLRVKIYEIENEKVRKQEENTKQGLLPITSQAIRKLSNIEEE